MMLSLGTVLLGGRCADIGALQNAAKLGMAVSIEASGEELMEQQERISPASPPF